MLWKPSSSGRMTRHGRPAARPRTGHTAGEGEGGRRQRSHARAATRGTRSATARPRAGHAAGEGAGGRRRRGHARAASDGAATRGTRSATATCGQPAARPWAVAAREQASTGSGVFLFFLKILCRGPYSHTAKLCRVLEKKLTVKSFFAVKSLPCGLCRGQPTAKALPWVKRPLPCVSGTRQRVRIR
ncbi:unnamed protein product [Urochloa humidicola]